MIKVNVVKQANYPVGAAKIKRELRDFFAAQGIVSAGEVSVVLVGKAKMLDLVAKYLKEAKMHSVLAFSEEELSGDFRYPPDGQLHLGEIVVCFPQVVTEAKAEGKLLEKKVWELVEHGANHLLGIHHT
jgi:rRNA maturation RNase YbeY